MYDHFKTNLDKRTIVHIWKANTNVTEVVANGYNVLLNVGYFNMSWYQAPSDSAPVSQRRRPSRRCIPSDKAFFSLTTPCVRVTALFV